MKITTHYDPNGEEWVLRLHSDNGSFASLGGLVGEAEAKMVQAVLQGALELHHCANTFDYSEGFRKGMKNADNMVEGRLLVEHLQSMGMTATR